MIDCAVLFLIYMASTNEPFIGIKRSHREDTRSQTIFDESHAPTNALSVQTIKKMQLSDNFGISNVASEEDLDKKTLLLQNQMLMQRLREYALKDELFNSERNIISQKRALYDNNYNYIKTVWNSFNSDLTSLLNAFSDSTRLPSTISSIQEENASDDEFCNSIRNVSQNLTFFRSNVGFSYENIEDDLKFASKLSRDFVNQLLQLFTRQRQAFQTITLALGDSSPTIDSISYLKKEILGLQQENNRLLTQIQTLYNDASCAEEKSLVLQLQLNNTTDQLSEYKDFLDDANFDLERGHNKICKLEHRLSTILTPQLIDRDVEVDNTFAIQKDLDSFTPPSRSSTCEEIQTKKREEQEEWHFLAQTRLQEVEELEKMLCNIKTELETRKLDGKLGQNIDVKLTPFYRSLQTQYTLVCANNLHLKNQCEELRKILKTCKQQYTSQLSDILDIQTRLKREALDEISRLEQDLLLSRRECDSLRLDFDGRNSIYEQAVLSNKELEATICSLRNNLRQVKHDLNRYRNLATESQNLADCLQEDKTNEKDKYETRIASNQKEICQLKDIIHDLKNKLKDLEEEEGEVKDNRKPGPSVEILDLKRQLDEKTRELFKRRDDYEQRLQSRMLPLKEEIGYLRQQLQSRKQEQDLFMKEMDVTGQAYEDEQERVSTLLKQIKEKDDANFKLMTERIKLNQLQKRMNEEREVFQKQTKVLGLEGASLREVASRLDNREKKSELSIINLEKETDLKEQFVENIKKKSQESTQDLQDNKFKLEESLHQLNVVEKALLSKTVEYELEVQKSRRIQEEFSIQRRKLDKLKKQQHSFTDEILLEEVKSYKAELTCPCCSQRKKDHILTKCFHVFCGECIKMRYETRQRKCPKCNANFGNNDWHKIYLT